jgi:hypothetical protein
MENWLETEGSPFIIIEEIDLMKWDSINNYKIICTAKNYAEKMNIKNKDILVFGDEAMPLKLINYGDEIIIFRWVYAPDEITVEETIKTLNYKMIPIIETVSINWNTNNLALFDAIKDNNEIENEYIKINTKNKKWEINTMEYKNDSVNIIIHKIKME